jgi:cell wall-associated NlpC family hydrolase
MVTRSNVVAEARRWIDTPFHHQGRSPAGVDCAGLAICIAQKLELIPVDYNWEAYGREPDGDRLLQEIEAFCTPIALVNFVPGDLLVFRIKTNPRHIAIASWIESLKASSMIHAYQNADGTGAVTENILDEQFWQPRLVAAYQLPNLTQEPHGQPI